ncbi:carbohydrate binding protein [Ruminiclostridium sufflavum DSM 19573]|uniref:Carbohydrate binding protein n=1 Tax=Ruminiclostridium sufflavum DSM 19573 TaxID=1121337 RepID=A0A318XMC9_9FIRM|nr:hypothetical protein [Ruminiclostridium sufflavum]PYG87092.1 carbohydrate binding protein [Ruminiclostridium sufflavum DSM 19573]
MKKALILFAVCICIAASALSDTMAVYTKTLPAVTVTVTAKYYDISKYPYWSFLKELFKEYKKGDIVQYNGKLYQRKDSGFFNHLAPDLNKSWVKI